MLSYKEMCEIKEEAESLFKPKDNASIILAYSDGNPHIEKSEVEMLLRCGAELEPKGITELINRLKAAMEKHNLYLKNTICGQIGTGVIDVIVKFVVEPERHIDVGK